MIFRQTGKDGISRGRGHIDWTGRYRTLNLDQFSNETVVSDFQYDIFREFWVSNSFLPVENFTLSKLKTLEKCITGRRVFQTRN